MGSIHTANGFYVYNYLGDGVFKVNFAIPINGNEDLIGLIYKAIDNGTITDATSLDLYAKNLRSEQRSNYWRIADAFEKRYGNGWYGDLTSATKAQKRRANIKNRYGVGRDASSRGAGGRNNEQEIQPVDGKTKLSLKEDVAAMDAAYVEAVKRGDVKMVARVRIRLPYFFGLFFHLRHWSGVRFVG